jgi:hypothetical protein
VTTSAAHTIGTAPAATPGQRPPVDVGRVVQGDWALWADWCTATDRDPHHATIPDLAGFLLELTATSGVQDRRVRSIVRTLTGTGHALPRPTTVVPVRTGPAWASHGDALAALRQEWHPEGVAARRDALILTLHAAGFTRTRITTLRPAQIHLFPDVAVDRVELPRHTDPVQCPRCAVVRWLQVLDAHRHLSRYDVQDLLTAARAHTQPTHDCRSLLEDGWRHTRWVISTIDRWGAIQPGTPVTPRGITGILARRYNPTTVHAVLGSVDQPVWDHEPVAPMGRRPAREEHEDVVRLWEQVEAEADQLNRRIQALLGESAH